MNLQKYPGLHLKFRLLGEKEESPAPAISLGFNTQGKGSYYYKEDQRHEQLAPDFYLAVSKSFDWVLGDFSLSGGINYSLQHADARGINIYAGFEHSIWKYCSVAFEVNPNLNDKNENIWKDGKSLMLNGGLRIAPTETMIIEIQFKDFLRNSNMSEEVGRYFGVRFISKFI